MKLSDELRGLTPVTGPVRSRDIAIRAADLLDEAERALDDMRGAMVELIAAVQDTGAFDNILADLMPEAHVRGNRLQDGLKRADMARNNARAQINGAVATLAKLRGQA